MLGTVNCQLYGQSRPNTPHSGITTPSLRKSSLCCDPYLLTGAVVDSANLAWVVATAVVVGIAGDATACGALTVHARTALVVGVVEAKAVV